MNFPMLKSIPNFRGLGSHLDNIKPLFYRTGNPSNISIEDAKIIKSLNVTHYVDLRSDKEVELYGKPIKLIYEGINWVHMPVQGYHAYFEDILYPSKRDYAEYYKKILRASEESTRKLVDLINKSPGILPLVFGCTAGKDRTGVISALLLLVMRHSDNDIMEDYALSSKYLLPRIDEYQYIWEQKNITKYDYMERLNTRTETMKMFLNYFYETHKSIENYFDYIGISKKDFKVFQRKITK